MKPEAIETDDELDQNFCARISMKNIRKPCKACTRAFANRERGANLQNNISNSPKQQQQQGEQH